MINECLPCVERPSRNLATYHRGIDRSSLRGPGYGELSKLGFIWNVRFTLDMIDNDYGSVGERISAAYTRGRDRILGSFSACRDYSAPNDV